MEPGDIVALKEKTAFRDGKTRPKGTLCLVIGWEFERAWDTAYSAGWGRMLIVLIDGHVDGLLAQHAVLITGTDRADAGKSPSVQEAHNEQNVT
jgi:hypothetical protein